MADAPRLPGRRYRMVRLLGQGQLGDLYLANDPLLGRDGALRILPPLSRDSRERLLATLESITRVRHPAIALLLEIGRHEDGLYVVREYIKGQTLSQMAAAKAPVPPRRRLEWMVVICQAVLRAHERGLFGLVPTAERPELEHEEPEVLKRYADRYVAPKSDADSGVGERTVLIRRALQKAQSRRAAQTRWLRTWVILGALVLLAVVVAFLFLRR